MESKSCLTFLFTNMSRIILTSYLRCGADRGITCINFSGGTCCSGHGSCGDGEMFCGDGCQVGFGTCGS